MNNLESNCNKKVVENNIKCHICDKQICNKCLYTELMKRINYQFSRQNII
jgi:hypothetical protein